MAEASSSGKYTPGEWRVDRPFYGKGRTRAIVSDHGEVARLTTASFGGEQQDANARLIAAAPELLAVAQMVVEASDLSGVNGPLGDAARAALSTALGEDR